MATSIVLGANYLLWRAVRARPRAALLNDLFLLAYALTSQRALADKAQLLLSLLNSASSVLERLLLEERPSDEPVSRAIWRGRCRQCVQRLRSFDLWIVLPNRQTRVDLQAEFTGLIHVLARGCLNELPIAEPSPRRKIAVFGSAMRSLLPGLIPLAAVSGAKFSPASICPEHWWSHLSLGSP